MMTFAGTPMAACAALARPQQSLSGVKRSTHVPVPRAWYGLVHEWFGLPKNPKHVGAIGWNSWQGIASSALTEVSTFRQKVLLWPTLPDHPEEWLPRLPSPPEMLKLCELLYLDQRWTLAETRLVEDALLAHMDSAGRWRVNNDKSVGV